MKKSIIYILSFSIMVGPYSVLANNNYANNFEYPDAESIINAYGELPHQEKHRVLTELLEEIEAIEVNGIDAATTALVVNRNRFLQQQNIPSENRHAIIRMEEYAQAVDPEVLEAEFHTTYEVDGQMNGTKPINMKRVQDAYQHDVELLGKYRRRFLQRLGFDERDIRKYLSTDYSILPEPESVIHVIDEQILGHKEISNMDIKRAFWRYEEASSLLTHIRNDRTLPRVAPPRQLPARPSGIQSATQTISEPASHIVNQDVPDNVRRSRFVKRFAIGFGVLGLIFVVTTVIASYNYLGISQTNQRLEDIMDNPISTVHFLSDLVLAIEESLEETENMMEKEQLRPGF